MKKIFSGMLALSLASVIAMAGEHPIGEPIEQNGMEIAAVYLQPIDMEPKGIDLAPSKADIHAIKGNANGFGEGEWIPYLKIAYVLKNLDTGKIQKGNFMPMVASDGPHYGANIKMVNGVGNYELTYNIENPSANGFGRHADKATGVGKWWEPFSVKYTFQYTGAPKE